MGLKNLKVFMKIAIFKAICQQKLNHTFKKSSGLVLSKKKNPK